jgi:hypothetical protein
VNQAVDFVLSKIALTVGTRVDGPRAPVRYEIPKEVAAEAIVNAVAHRNYTSTGSVQVMVFTFRLEIWNHSQLPPSLTFEKLREQHGSVPYNPLLAEPMYLAGYIDRMGTGTEGMIRPCFKQGLPELEFAVTDGLMATIRRASDAFPEVTPEVGKFLGAVTGELIRTEIMAALGLKDEDHLPKRYLQIAKAARLMEMTRPKLPRSHLQKYRLSDHHACSTLFDYSYRWSYGNGFAIWCGWHLYHPLISRDCGLVEISPIPLGTGKQRFVEDLNAFPDANPDNFVEIVSNTPSHVMNAQWAIQKQEMTRRHILFQEEDRDTYIGAMLQGRAGAGL